MLIAKRKLRFRSIHALCILGFLILSFMPSVAGAADWFVSPSGNGSSGSSWSAAWRELDDINWSQIRRGDTIYVDGGSNAVTYRTELHVPPITSGPSGAPIVMRRSTETGRNGTIRLVEPVRIEAEKFILEGGNRDRFIIELPAGSSGYALHVESTAENAEIRNVSLTGRYGGAFGSLIGLSARSALVHRCRFTGSTLEDQLKINTGGVFIVQYSEFLDLQKQGDKHADLVQARATGYTLIFRYNVFQPEHPGVQIFQIQTPNGGDIGDLIFENNTFVGPAHVGIHLKSNISRRGRFQIYNNIFTHMPAATGDLVAGADIRNNLWGPGASATRPGNGNFAANPAFHSNTFRLAANSPAIDAGYNVGQTVDNLGRPINGAPDIGAFEFQSGELPIPPDGAQTLITHDFTRGVGATTNFGWTGRVESGQGSAFSGDQGLCMTVNGKGDNVVEWSSPTSYVDLAPHTLYHVRLHMSTDQSNQDSIPLWELAYDNYQGDGDLNPNFVSYGGSRWFLDIEGGANGIGRTNGRTAFDAIIGPLALATPQWNGRIADEGNADSAFAPEAQANSGFRLRVRVQDDNAAINADMDEGLICLDRIEIQSIPYESLHRDARNIYSAPLSPQSHFTQIDAHPSIAGEVTAEFRSGAIDVQLPGNVDGSGKIVEDHVRLMIGPDDQTAGPNWVVDPIQNFDVRNPFRKFPVAWKTDAVYRGRVALSAPEDQFDPVDIISLTWASYTFELGGQDWVTCGNLDLPGGMARAGSPRPLSATGGTPPQWVSFFHGNNVTDSIVTNADRLTLRAEFFNRADLGLVSDPLAKAAGGTDPIRVHSLNIDEIMGIQL